MKRVQIYSISRLVTKKQARKYITYLLHGYKYVISLLAPKRKTTRSACDSFF